MLGEISQSQKPHIYYVSIKIAKKKKKEKTVTAPNAGQDVEKWHRSYIADGNLT